VTGLNPVPLSVTALVFVNVVPELDTVAEPEYVVAAVGQNRTVTVAALPDDTEKLDPAVMPKALGVAATVPEAGDVPDTCWIMNDPELQLPT
jgi:hypothetical protein